MHRRRYFALLVLLAVSLAFPMISSAQDVTPNASPAPENLAPKDVADKAVETLTTWFKRVGSTNPDVRHRAWEMMSADGQNNLFFPGDEEYFNPTKSNLFQIGDVTLEADNQIGVDTIFSGIYFEHTLYHMKFLLSAKGDSFQIDNVVLLPTTAATDMTSASFKVSIRDESIKINKTKTAEKDALLFTISNKGTSFHYVEIDRLTTGETQEDLTNQIVNQSQDRFIFTGVALGTPITVGAVDMEPGDYALVGINLATAGTQVQVTAYTTFTVTAS